MLEPVEKWVAFEGGAAKHPVKMLALWNVSARKLEADVEAPHCEVLAASPDGKTVFEGGVDKRLRIRNGRTLKLEAELRVHSSNQGCCGRTAVTSIS